MRSSSTFRLTSLALLIGASTHAGAFEVYSDADTHLNLKVDAVYGLFHSGENYAQTGTKNEGSSNWQEGYAKYGLNFDRRLGDFGTTYGAFGLLSSASWGDGDAGGFTDGTERTTKIEDASLGWRSGNLFPALGADGVDVSGGRQNIVVGDGFLIDGDALNLGKGVDDGSYNRGGAYWLAARKNFDQTAVLRLGGTTGWRSDLMYLKSDNRAQADSEMFVGTLEHINDAGTVGLTYIDVNDIDKQFATPMELDRDGMKVYSLRGKTSAGITNLALSGEYAYENKRTAENENAWYLQGVWTFADTPWKPSVTYRYSRFSKDYDTLFYGFASDYGTWFQGEVAGNYAGPFNTNSRIQHAALKASPLENLSVGALLFKYDTIDKNQGNLDGRELDFFAEWGFNEHVTIMPVVGFFQPDKSAEQGGSQIGNDHTNVYSQLVFATTF